MLQSEFTERTGVNVTPEEYSVIEKAYNNVKMGKDDFCALWKKVRNNRLFNEMVDAVNLMDADLSMKDKHIGQLENEVQLLKFKEYERVKALAAQIIRADGEEIRTYEILEQEFGMPFIIKVKREAGIPLSNEEIDYMVSLL